MTDDTIASLLEAYRRHIAWMQSRADSYLNGGCRHLERDGDSLIDRTIEVGEELLGRASKLQAVIAAFEKLGGEDGFQLGWPIPKVPFEAANIPGTMRAPFSGSGGEHSEQP